MLFSDELKIDIIFTTGGTGFGLRDVTPEATRCVIDREAPQLANYMFFESLKKTKFAALSRAVCGIRNRTLIINFPGSKKAVQECFDAIVDIISHAIHLICDEQTSVKETHSVVQNNNQMVGHICPHKTGSGGDDRNSTYPMISVSEALDIIFRNLKRKVLDDIPKISPINIPAFRASIKDGYAVKHGSQGLRKVIGYINAGDSIVNIDFNDDECYKINTGAPIPIFATAIVQIEDTKLIESDPIRGVELKVEILVNVPNGLDIREIGSDLSKDSILFDHDDPITVAEKSVLASVGIIPKTQKNNIKIGIISTGSELVSPPNNLSPGKIYDSNSTMLKLLVEQFGFEVYIQECVDDNYETLRETLTNLKTHCDVVICSGGVSMGDKDYVKPVVQELCYDIKFGRVNMKPGKPMTFGFDEKENKSFFGLPGNPVSAFVTFHLFVLPCLKFLEGYRNAKCNLAKISVKVIFIITY